MSNNSAKKIPGIIWLYKNGFDLDLVGFNHPIKYVFAPEVMTYLEIIDEVKLETSVSAFITQNRLPPCDLIMVLAPDVLFEKEFLNLPADQIKNSVQKFTDTVPFENIYSKTWSTGGKLRLVVFNSDIFNSLKNIFEKLGSGIRIAIPYFAVPYFLAGKNQLNQETTVSLINKGESLRQDSIMDNPLIIEDTSSENGNSSQPSGKPVKKNSKKDLMLIGIFLILMIVFFAAIYWQFFMRNTS